MTSSDELHQRAIPSTGELLPVIGLGTWQTFDVGTSRYAPLEAVLTTFSKNGGRLLDTSPMYGRAEQVSGDLLHALGQERQFFVATKVWTRGKAAGIAQMERSMQLLRTPTIDLMQVHNLLDAAVHLRTLREWKEGGRIRYIGITHYHASAHADVERMLRSEPVDFLQINYSLAEREAEQRLLPLAADKGIAVLANRPFAEGQLFRQFGNQRLPAWATELDITSWGQFFLKFIVSHPAITCAIPATSHASHLEDNLGGGRGRMPSASERARMASLIGS